MIYDISQEVFSCNVYPGDMPPSYERVKRMPDDMYNLTNIEMCVHNGTHIDAPRHFIEDGKTIDELDLTTFYGPCIVAEKPVKCERLLIKGNYTITEQDARQIVQWGVQLVGVESQSVGDPDNLTHIHLILLNAGIVPLEGLVLSAVPCGEYTLSAFPLNLGGSEGSPVRAVLIG